MYIRSHNANHNVANQWVRFLTRDSPEIICCGVVSMDVIKILVRVDQLWLPKLVRSNQKWSGLENSCHLLHVHGVRPDGYPSLILSVVHDTIPATFCLVSKQLFCNSLVSYADNLHLNST